MNKQSFINLFRLANYIITITTVVVVIIIIKDLKAFMLVKRNSYQLVQGHFQVMKISQERLIPEIN